MKGLNRKWAGLVVLGLCAGVAGAQNVVSPLNAQGGGNSFVYSVGQGGAGGSFVYGAEQGGEGAGQAEAKVKDDLFAGTEKFAKGAADVTEITMDPDSLDQVQGPAGAHAHNMVLNIVRTYTYEKPGMYNMADVEEYRNKLNSGEWHCSVHIREMKNGESTDVCRKHRTDGLREEAIITVEPKSLTFIHTIRKDERGGRGELGGLPMVIDDGHALPLVANVLPESMAEMRANLAIWRAEQAPALAAMQAEIAAALADGRMHVLNGDEFKKFDQKMKEFKFDKLPEVKVKPMAPMKPMAPPHVESAPKPAPVPEAPME